MKDGYYVVINVFCFHHLQSTQNLSLLVWMHAQNINEFLPSSHIRSMTEAVCHILHATLPVFLGTHSSIAPKADIGLRSGDHGG
jgi:hypothetical protein